MVWHIGDTTLGMWTIGKCVCKHNLFSCVIWFVGRLVFDVQTMIS
jgi:hypothetical protein